MSTSETLYINSEIMDNIKLGYKKCTSKFDNHVDDSSKRYKNLKSNNLYTKGFNKVEKALNETSHSISNCNSVNDEFLEKFMLLEKKGIEMVNEIYIPTDFQTSGDLYISGFNSTNLYKQDGKAINKEMVDDTTTEETTEVVKEDLKNIEKETEPDIEVESVELDKVDIKDINNENTSDIEVDNSTTVEESKINNIDNNYTDSDIEIDKVNINKEQLDNVEQKDVIDSVNGEMITEVPTIEEIEDIKEEEQEEVSEEVEEEDDEDGDKSEL